MENRQRLAFIDNIRVLLILLVIAHHVGQAYGPTGGWWAYLEPERAPWLSILFGVDRAFFMSLFFMIAGYFMPASFDGKGPARFLKDRFMRFGIPILFFLLIVIPLQHYAYFLHFRHYGDVPFLQYYVDYYCGFGVQPADWGAPGWPEANIGHLWFVEHLLLFAVVYALIKVLWKRPLRKRAAAAPGHVHILLISVAIAAACFTVRIWSPVDHWIVFLGFIQVAFADVPRDLAWFIVGIVAYRNDWLTTLRKSTGFIWFAVGIAMIATVILAAEFPDIFWWLRKPKSGAGIGINSVILPLRESLLCSGMCIGLTVLFRECLNFQNRFFKTAAEDSFAAYLVHVAVAVSLQYAAQGLALEPTAKFFLVTALTVLVSFSLAHGLRKIPPLRRIL